MIPLFEYPVPTASPLPTNNGQDSIFSVVPLLALI